MRRVKRPILAVIAAAVLASGTILAGCGQETGTGDGASENAGGGGTTDTPEPEQPEPTDLSTPVPPTTSPPIVTPTAEPTTPASPPDPAEPPKGPGEDRTFQITGAGEVEPTTLRVDYQRPTPCSPGLREAEVTEDADTVRITLYQKPPPAGDPPICAQVIVEETTDVTLSEPLGDRQLVDGATGAPIPIGS